MAYLIHENTWPWGQSITIMTEDAAGMVQISLETDHPGGAYLKGVSVIPSRRRQGIAKRMLHYALELCRSRGVTYVELDAEPDAHVLHLYESFGFKPFPANEYGQIPMLLRF